MRRAQANGLLLVAALIWGTAFVAQQTGMRDVGPFTFTGARFLFGTVMVAPLAFLELRRLGRRGPRGPAPGGRGRSAAAACCRRAPPPAWSASPLPPQSPPRPCRTHRRRPMLPAPYRRHAPGCPGSRHSCSDRFVRRLGQGKPGPNSRRQEAANRCESTQSPPDQPPLEAWQRARRFRRRRPQS